MKRRTQSLRFNLLLPVILTVVVIVALMSITVSRVFTKKMLEQESARIETSFTITGQSISNLLRNVQTTSSIMLTDADIEAYAVSNFSNNVERVLARRKVLQTISHMLDRSPALYGLIFLRDNGSAFGSMPYRSVFYEEDSADILTPRILEDIYGISERQAWIGPITGSDLYHLDLNSKIPDQFVIGFTRNRLLRYGTIYTLAVVDVQTLRDYLEFFEDGRGGIYLTNADGDELCRTKASEPMPEDMFNCIDPEKMNGSKLIGSTDGVRYYISYHYIASLGWYFIRRLPVAAYDRAADEIRQIVWLLALMFLGIAVLFYLWWLKRFIQTFDALKAGIVSLREGNLGTQIDQPFQITEFESIRSEFNTMNTALKQQMQKVNAMERVKLEMELRVLQTQLSPHMIFNSITAIRWMAEMIGADQVSNMLSELSEMLRPVFRDWKIEWTIREELEHLKHYARLLDLRYGNNFSMTTEVDDWLLDCMIPRFTIQPLVENSCEHGSVGTEKLNVDVCIRSEWGWIELRVADNGSGIEPEKLEKIRAREFVGIGLTNAYNRIRLCKGDDSTLDVNCPESGGTELTIRWRICLKS